VSIAWLWLFARTFRVTVDLSSCAALFLTAWSIYLADRLADSCSLPPGAPRSLRHTFCLEHRRILVGGLALIAGVNTILIWNRLGPATLIAGAIVGSLALIHLVLNYWLGGAWPPLPMKEAAVGSLFAAGTLVPLFSSRPISGSFLCAGILFAALCTLNCISIAYWEQALDEEQGKVSFATRYPGLRGYLGKSSLALALGSLGATAIVYPEVGAICACVTVSALGLMSLDSEKIDRDRRTAWADIVLLNPLLLLVVMSV
jgi:hypothetical protein